MKCNYCGTDNPAQARFCGRCGKKFVHDEEEHSVASQPLNEQSLSARVSTEQEAMQVSNGPVLSLTEQIAPKVPSATPVIVSTADQVDAEIAESRPEVETPSPPLPSIWPFTGLNQESIKSYPPEIGLMSPSPPPGWPIFQENSERIQQPLSTKAQPTFLTWLLKPWSRPAFYGSIAALALVLILLIVTGSDWASGTIHAAIMAAIVALLLIGALGVRLMMERAAQTSAQKRTQYMSAGLVILVLLLYMSTALSFQPAIHTVQGHSLEQSHQWKQAIAQYQLGGDTAPTSVNIARTYNEWGQNLAQQQHYQQAIDNFEMVVNKYGRAGSQVSIAQKNAINAYIAAGKQDQQKQDYSGAVTQFAALLNLNYCDVQCQKDNQSLAANAYYSLAKSQLATAQYSDAVDTFATLQQRFPTSSAYQTAHEDIAKALFALGLQEINTNQCSAAVLNYQQLARAFADTVQGKNAALALKAPQPVKGHFTKPLPRGRVLAVLTQGLTARAWKNQFNKVLAKHPPITTVLANGTFQFKPLKQGTYDLSWGNIATNGKESFGTDILASNPGTYYYVAHVGPLCPFNFGNITMAIPKAS